MKFNRLSSAAAVLSIAGLALTACGSDNVTGANGEQGGQDSGLSGSLTGVGSSAQKAAMEAWSNGFQQANSGVTVQYSPDGSGAGRKAFIGGGANFGASDAYLDEEELESAKQVCGPDGAFDIPAYVSPIAVAYNLEGVDTLNLDAETIAKIFKMEITKWNDKAIAEQNPDAELPDTKITVVHRSDESGTTENFVAYLAAAAKDVWDYEVGGAWPSDLQSENAKGTSGVVSTTSSTDGAITYADASAVGDLNTANVKVGEEYTEISAEAAAKALEVAEPVEGRSEHDIALELQYDTEEVGTYPIVMVSYHLYCSTYKDQETADLVKAFGNYVVSEEGQTISQESAGSAPLSAEVSEKAAAAIDSITVAE